MADMMADKLKPSVLDTTDAETLAPSTNVEVEAYCATVISNIEGWRFRTLPSTKEGRRATIEQLEIRVRRLENMESINPPPPMDTPSWDSLMWRVARLHRRMPQGRGTLQGLAAAPPYFTPTMALLRSIVPSIGGEGMYSWAEFAEKETNLMDDDDDMLQAAAQFLCYTAGRSAYKIVGSFDLKQVCKLALDLSLDQDANSNTIHVVPPRRIIPSPLAPIRRVGSLACGCCGCSCHHNTRENMPKPSVLKWMNGKYREERETKRNGLKARIARAFGKLAFWNRHRDQDTDSDASSISTWTTSTCA
ncbi:hypothetical protein F5Y14DRAFT_442058 [Nemania sp. NC0429]|nr:hypothetical protein F5Y14DRAFT_442058 [Nemania sp. NC0429]